VTKRGLPAPLDAPPFPFSDWTYGGAPDIGAPDGNTYPYNVRTQPREQPHESVRVGRGQLHFQHLSPKQFSGLIRHFFNKIELNQAVVYIERFPDTVQTSHFDWGYHVTGFFGIDYRFTTAKGF
jgi:hypothetical protein